MNPAFLLLVLAALADFFLKTTLAFALCFVCSRLVHSPKGRLAVWLSFLFGAAGYWLWLARDIFSAGAPVSRGVVLAPQTAAFAAGVWHVQTSWAFPLGVALRGAGIIYLVVLAYSFASWVRDWRRLQWVMKFTTSAPESISERFQVLADKLGVGRSRLLVLSGVSSPATFGWISPTVLLPEVCLQQDSADLDDILLHELHHVLRRDFMWSRLATTCRALVFFQPACSYALRRLELERELACDLEVVNHVPEHRATYAECLVRFARLNASQQEKAWGIDFASSQNLKLRVHSILAESRRLPVWSVCLRAASGVMLLAAFIGVVPSLAVLLSYTRHMEQPLQSGIVEPLPVVKTIGSARGRRPAKSVLSSNPAASLGQISGERTSPARVETDEVATEKTGMIPGGSGPKLMKRPLSGAAAGNPRQQSVALLDSDTVAQNDKTADRKQAVEQTATTVLGVYSRLNGVDRH